MTWTAGAFLFSGRRDPTWPVEDGTAEHLAQLWTALGPATGDLPEPPPLGYRGVFLRDDAGREWRAYAGVVRLRAEARADADRVFERALAASAPEEVRPLLADPP